MLGVFLERCSESPSELVLRDPRLFQHSTEGALFDLVVHGDHTTLAASTQDGVAAHFGEGRKSRAAGELCELPGRKTSGSLGIGRFDLERGKDGWLALWHGELGKVQLRRLS